MSPCYVHCARYMLENQSYLSPIFICSISISSNLIYSFHFNHVSSFRLHFHSCVFILRCTFSCLLVLIEETLLGKVFFIYVFMLCAQPSFLVSVFFLSYLITLLFVVFYLFSYVVFG